MLDAKVPPGPKGHFLLGNALQYERDPLGFLTRCAREYGEVVRFRVPGMTMYLLSHPRDIEYVLRTNHHNFVKDRFWRARAGIFGQGLVTSEGDLWRRQRGLSQPSFQSKQFETYAPVMVAYTERMLLSWGTGGPRDVHSAMMRLSMEITAKVLFDLDIGQHASELGDVFDVILSHFARPALVWFLLPEWLPLPENLRFRGAIRRLDRIIYGLISERRARGTDAGDLLSRLLHAHDQEGNRMTDQQLRDELVTLFLAGHETTALALTYCFHLLGQNPEADAKLAAELKQVLGDRVPSVADVPLLRYAEGVVRESLRLYPPVWTIGREPRSDCEIGGYPIRKGTPLLMMQWVVHRDGRWFEDAETFKPERWADDLARRLPRCAYFPFGDGPRICIGNNLAMTEAVLILATVAQRYRLTPAPGRPIELVPSITLRPKHGIPMVASRR
jgi:cytochrome P450